jgi:cytochrome c-type biogenesis protein CcmH
MMQRIALLACLLLGGIASAQIVEGFEDPVLDARYSAFIETIRCMKCQNQSIAKSPADQATDIKLVIKELMEAGQSNGEIRAFLVERYGDFISYKPPFKPSTWLLWFAPGLLLLGAGLAFYRILRTRMSQPLDEALDG